MGVLFLVTAYHVLLLWIVLRTLHTNGNAVLEVFFLSCWEFCCLTWTILCLGLICKPCDWSLHMFYVDIQLFQQQTELTFSTWAGLGDSGPLQVPHQTLRSHRAWTHLFPMQVLQIAQGEARSLIPGPTYWDFPFCVVHLTPSWWHARDHSHAHFPVTWESGR